MSSHPFFEIFPRLPAVTPVIHIEEPNQAVACAQIALDEGADGIWLIDHQCRGPEFTLAIFEHIHEEEPDFWVGVNFLTLRPTAAFRFLPNELGGYWSDSIGLHNRCDEAKATEVLQAQKASQWPGLHFGGMAFKGQFPEVADEQLEEVTRLATNYLSPGVVTTSGRRTGSPPTFDKIKRMKDALGDLPLAVASGMTPENVGPYLGLIDCYLLATGITNPDTEILVPERLGAFMRAVGR